MTSFAWIFRAELISIANMVRAGKVETIKRATASRNTSNGSIPPIDEEGQDDLELPMSPGLGTSEENPVFVSSGDESPIKETHFNLDSDLTEIDELDFD
jgi:hypothetical protein